MSLFSPDQVRELIADFPDRPVHEICQQVERKAAAESVSSPMGLARAWLKRAKVVPQHSTTEPTLPVRGTFGAHGEWIRGSLTASEWESRLIQAARDIRRQFLSPAQAVQLIADRGLSDMVREGPMRVWAQLESVTAWPCAPCSTSAEQWLKTYVIGS